MQVLKVLKAMGDGFLPVGPINPAHIPGHVLRQEEPAYVHLQRPHLHVHPGSHPDLQTSNLSPKSMTRRGVLGGAVITAATIALPSEVHAGQSGPQLQRAYYDNTRRMIDQIKDIMAVSPDDPELADKFQAFKTSANAWVGDYRRLVGPRQKSYAETYGVLSALTGHMTTYGLGAPDDKRTFPAKLLEAQQKRLELAERALARELASDPDAVTTL